MTEQKRPEWIQKAAVAVAALYGVEHAKEHAQAAEAKRNAEAHPTHEKIADVIHRHFQEHK